ncbi:mucin-12 isoform X2 [Hyalella azteca]|uniref:Mucin-12 isoform X2 n=1 Tax=Hyalella azteca TaxID=294128 RepID=A0A8B7NI32_HYAAZ|nr:mucin-12 isoform X2 [Hyalella azteca]
MNNETKFCANCKKEVASLNFTVHVVHCTRNVAQCTVCGEPVSRSQYQHHLQSQHGSLDCNKCGAKVEAVKIFTHQQDECPRRMLSCQYCELQVQASELQKHTDACGSRTERCKGCTKYVQLRHLQFHYNSDHKYLAPEDKEKKSGSDSGDEGGDECPVCLGPVTLPIALECGHVFCMVCVKGIANTTKNCAICRRDIPRDMLMDIRFCREEDVIKNYVNKPRDTKKSFRSQSVPSRSQASLPSRRTTTQDYDDMVSHLLSSRTSSTSYRYQRPNNSHTPPTYTPYSYTTNTSTCNTSTTTGSSNDDDCCCSSISQQSKNSTTEQISVSSASVEMKAQTNSSSLHSASSDVTTRAVITSSESKPKRPTSLALSSSLNEPEPAESMHRRGRREPPVNATQEQYDRWLAFQLAQADEDIPAAEFNKKHRAIVGRSQSMPERAIAAVTQRTMRSSDSSDSSDDEQDKGTDRAMNRRDSQNRPPASPRTTPSQSCGSSSSSYSSSSSLSASSRSPSLTKSSSDSNTSGSGGGSSGVSLSSSRGMGARPKSSTGLKKRVSFKEDAPEERRVAPIMLPCEFCGEMFSERDLMRHQTSCDLNETQMPRTRRDSLATPPMLNSPTRSVTSPTGSSRTLTTASNSSTNLESPVSPASRRKVPPNLPLGSSKRAEHSRIVTADAHRTPPTSPPPRPPHPPAHSTSTTSTSRIRCSPQPSSHELTDSSCDSRPTSVSPCPPHSNSCSSGISSMASSTRSVSSTPSSSSSASPIPAVVDTPTDIEADFEDDDTPFVRPRRGKLLSSAIVSWRTMSGAKDRFKYSRSNTAPLEDTGDEPSDMNPVVNSHSASQLPPLPPRHESVATDPEQSKTENNTSSSSSTNPPKSRPQVFIKKQKKYRAPQPPSQSPSQSHAQSTSISSNDQCYDSSNSCKKVDNTSNMPYMRLDSKPMMDVQTTSESTSTKFCECCRKEVKITNFQSHQKECQESSGKEEEKLFRGERALVPHNATPAAEDSEREAPFSGADECSTFSPHRARRYERAQSVLDERCFDTRRESSLMRTHSIKETSRPSTLSSMGRRWTSREMLFSPRGESTSFGSSSSSFGGSSLIGGKFSSRGWSDHVSMVQEDVKAKLTSAKALLYGSSRYRSSSMARSSLYAPSFGSSTRITSLEYRSPYDSISARSSFGTQDSFGSSFRRRYVP